MQCLIAISLCVTSSKIQRMNKAVIYARVSTDEQADNGKSIETQEKICNKWAKDNDYRIIEIYKDEGKSATNLNRPALKELLARCQKQDSIDAILIQDTDRLARNTLDHLTIKALLKKHDVKLVSISQPMLDDSPEGNLIDTIIASVNAFQSQITGRKTSKVMEEKARLGWYPGGLPPLGYKNLVNPSPLSTLDKKIIGFDQQTAPLMKKVFEMYSTGNYSIKDLADFLNKKGVISPRGFKIHISTLNNFLRDEFYIGKFMWKKIQYDGNHAPLIEKGLFNKVQLVLDAHNQYASRKRKHNYLLRGFLYCSECGNRYWAEKHKKKSGLIYDFYFCSSCKGDTYTDVSKLEKKVEKLFERIELSKKYTDHVRETARRILDDNRRNQDGETNRLQAEKSKVEKAMRETEDDRFVHKTLTPEAFQRIYERYENDLKNIENEMKNVKKDYSRGLQVLEKILTLAENIGVAYSTAKEPLQRKYLGLFFKRFTVKGDRIVKYELSDDLKELIENGSVRVRSSGLAKMDDF